MVDVEVQHQSHRVRLIREISSQLNVPTLRKEAYFVFIIKRYVKRKVI
jgi:hypothetical protein